MSKWSRLVKALDRTFLLSALLCSSILFILVFGLFLDMASVARESSATSFTVAGVILLVTYFYWFFRAVWYMINSYRGEKR